jgi:hypothetical protein
MHVLHELFIERISSGLKRKSVTTCSKWAESYRVIKNKKWSFLRYPWLREMHDSETEINIGQKAAQMGYTETALNITFFNIDIKGVDCLYILPAKTPDAGDFSSGRFDPALEESEHLSKLFSDVKNVGHKRAGPINLYIRGSKSRAGLKSIPTGLIILDEVDEMVQKNIPLAFERSSGQEAKQRWLLSTPTIDNFGINAQYQTSTQEIFAFKCPGCSKYTTLEFPDCLDITAENFDDPEIMRSSLKCKECKVKLPHETKSEWQHKGIWVPTYSNRIARGFHIGQLYSPTVSPGEFAISYLKSLSDPAEEQEFYNSKLGIPHIVEGARVTDAHIDNCLGTFKKADTTPRGLLTMGVDVGRWLHYEIDYWTTPRGSYAGVDINLQSRPRIIAEGKCLNFDELDKLMQEFMINMCVIDANPERRKAHEFATRFWGHVKLCFYGRGINGKQIHVSEEQAKIGGDDPTILVDRTSWLDLALGRFRTQNITLPQDVSREYRENIKAPVRIYEKDSDGNPIGKYVTGNSEDHFAHARNYAEIALPLAATINVSKNIGKIM